jgi:hypothetical protein
MIAGACDGDGKRLSGGGCEEIIVYCHPQIVDAW